MEEFTGDILSLPQYSETFHHAPFLHQNPLNEQTVIDYFFLSPFVTGESSRKSVSVVVNGGTHGNGFVLKKENGICGDEYYYCMEGTIFRAPPLYDVLSARLMRRIHTLNKGLHEAIGTMNKVREDRNVDTEDEYREESTLKLQKAVDAMQDFLQSS